MGESSLQRADAAVALMCALASAAMCWLLSGWSKGDARRAFTEWSAAARAEAVLLMRAVQTVAQRMGSARVAPGATVDVGLGEVCAMVDIVRLGLSAGLSFDASLGLYCEGGSGALPAHMERARLLWQTGMTSREEALRMVANAVGVRALESFAVAVSQALALGAPLVDTLAGQSREMRVAHRADVERQIERAPVKLLIPTGTLILPALLLSIVGPLLAASGMV